MKLDIEIKAILKHVIVFIYLVLLECVSHTAFAAGPIKAGWKVDAITASPSENIRLNDKDKQVVAVVNRTRIVRLKDTLSRIQSAAGITSEFWLVQLTDSKPSAFATTKDGKNHVLVSLTMLDLLGDDMDAYAFLFGHEIAHIMKQHGVNSQARKGFLQGLGFIAALIVGAKTGYNVGSLTDLGADLIDKTYSRDQEREADELGFSYMVTAGFNTRGAVTLNRSLLSASKSTPLPFFSTHPGGEERISNLEKMIASLPSPSIARIQPLNTPDTASVSNPSEESVFSSAKVGISPTIKQNSSEKVDGNEAQPSPEQEAIKRPEEAQKQEETKRIAAVGAPSVSYADNQGAQRLVILEPSNVRAWRDLAKQYQAANETDKAIRAYQEADRLEPDDVNTIESLGIVYAKVGQKEKAHEMWKRLVKIDQSRADKFFTAYILPQ